MRKILISIVMAVLIGSVQIAAATPITIGFSPSTSISSSIGGTYSVDVIISYLPAGGIVSAFDLSILYNSTLLNATSVNFNSLLGESFAFEVLQSAILTSPGVINFAAVSLLSDSALQALQSSANGTITLATLNFSGLAAGSSTLAFDWYKGKDVKGLNNQVIAGYVPEPGTFLLFGSGLLSLLGFRRRGNLLAWFRR
jgi:hypothetical protein